jgi:hypothetical protein
MAPTIAPDRPDDNLPRWPDPAIDELASAQARRYRLIAQAWDREEPMASEAKPITIA